MIIRDPTGKLDLDGQVEDNFGADQGGTVRFTATNGTAAGLTAGGAMIYLYVSEDGQTLIGSTFAGGQNAESGDVLAKKVFTINLNVSAGGVDTYDFTLHQQIDGGAGGFTTTEGDFDFSGGNKQWVSFDSGEGSSQDILITPINGSTVNTTNSIGGTAGVGNTTVGSSRDGNQAIRVDYVNNLSGTASSGGSYDINNPTHTFDGHYSVNGATAILLGANNTTIRVTAYDYSQGYEGNLVGSAAGDNISPDTITRVVINFNGLEGSLNISGWQAGQTGQIVLSGNGGEYTYGVTFNGKSVDISGLGDGVQVGVSTADGFNSVEYQYLSGGNFQIGGFGGVTFEPGVAVDFGIDLDIIDGDGDSLTVMDAIKLQLAPDSHIVQEGGDGEDSLTVADGTEGLLLGGDGDDTLTGNDGNDIIYGGDGDDTIVGVGGDNLLYGGAGNDTIIGGEGNDTIIGGAGDDTLTGGGGNNVFVWHLGDQGSVGEEARDTVTDFGDRANKLVLSDLLQGMESGDDLSSFLHATQDGENTLLHISSSGGLSVDGDEVSGADQVIILEGVDYSESLIQQMLTNGQLEIE
ncbi:hypothetical protein [Halomonas sp. JS92-SW72]|uniref:hypothetical protein n=1 Tax=Halomonas sp. JS92-SW72 TaxID=2306583 RepID=UPI000E5A5D3A|nr:hypothetical protein [Halomonas sp. JS92-SW72]AXY43824.1 hypothetical protein D1793_17385 [Halomonas sp. JS92-SW72]